MLGVTRAGYYAYLKRPKMRSQIEREALRGFIVETFSEHKGRYGANRISRELTKQGIPASRRRVSSMMQELGLRAKGGPRPYGKHKSVPYEEKENLLDRVFNTGRKNRVWVGDITYIHTRQGFLYLAVMMDIFSRKVVGWSMSDRINENLTILCLEQAIAREEPERGLLIHTDYADKNAKPRNALSIREALQAAA